MGRLLAFSAIGLTLAFAVFILLMPNFAPETAVLPYSVSAEDEDAIWLLDVEHGARYFSGLYALRGNRMVWSPDGSAIATLNYYMPTAQLEVTDLKNGRRDIYPLDEPQQSFQWSPDGNAIVYHSRSGRLYLIDLITGEETLLISGENFVTFRWMPDGNTVLLVDLPDLFLMDIQSREITLILERIEDDAFFVTYESDTWIYLQDGHVMIAERGATDEARQLMAWDSTSSRFGDMLPTDQFVMNVDHEGEKQVWLVDMHTGEQELVFASEYYMLHNWSPDGTMIASLAQSNVRSSTIEILQSDGQLTHTFTVQGRVSNYFWSPDSRYLAVFADLNATNVYYLIDLLDNEVTLLDVELLFSLLWQPITE